MKLYLVTHKESRETKIVKAGNYQDAKVLAARGKLKSEDWTSKPFVDPYGIGAKTYWSKHVPADMVPRWAQELYGIKA